MKEIDRGTLISCLILAVTISAGSAFAGFIDFENGVDGQPIASTITGLEFTNTAGYDWLYGDWRTNDYNGCYPNYSILPDYPLDTQYYSDGNFFAWMGTDQGTGVITFTESYATYCQVGYSTYSGVTLEAYNESGNLMDSDSGSPNVGTGRLDYLRVEAPGMAYVTIYGTNNQWLIDNLDTDAIQQCTENAQCDDGVYCNGEELCDQYLCVDGEAVDCSDDGIFCNGEESCSEAEQACVHSGDPCSDDGLFCNGSESCNEGAGECVHSGDPCPEGQCNEETDDCEPLDGDDDNDDNDNDYDDDQAELDALAGGCCF